MGVIEAFRMAKRDMPRYMFRFTYVYTLLYFLSVVLIMIGGGIGGSILSESHPNMELLPLIVAGVIVVLLTVGFLFKAHLVYKRFTLETASMLQSEYEGSSLEDAEAWLKENKILDDTGFLYAIVKGPKNIEKGRVLFEGCKLYFCARYWVGKVRLSVTVLSDDGKRAIVSYNMSPALCCYLREKNFFFVNEPTFSLFAKDKKRFVKLLLRCQNGDSPLISRIDKKADKEMKK